MEWRQVRIVTLLVGASRARNRRMCVTGVCVRVCVCMCMCACAHAGVYMVEVMMLKCVRAVCFLFVQLGLRDLDLLFIALHNATMLPSSVPT